MGRKCDYDWENRTQRALCSRKADSLANNGVHSTRYTPARPRGLPCLPRAPHLVRSHLPSPNDPLDATLLHPHRASTHTAMRMCQPATRMCQPAMRMCSRDLSWPNAVHLRRPLARTDGHPFEEGDFFADGHLFVNGLHPAAGGQPLSADGEPFSPAPRAPKRSTQRQIQHSRYVTRIRNVCLK